jgi:AraC-like DNA-binding protein
MINRAAAVMKLLAKVRIAFKAGYSSQAYFSTVFKSKFSLTPTEYREKKKGRR